MNSSCYGAHHAWSRNGLSWLTLVRRLSEDEALEKVRVELTRDEVVVEAELAMERQVGLDTLDDELVERASQPPDRRVAIFCMLRQATITCTVASLRLVCNYS